MHGWTGRPGARRLPAAALALLFLAGCSGSERQPEDPAPEETADRTGGGGGGADTGAALPDSCAEWADGPDGPEPIALDAAVISAVWEKADGYLELTASLRNTTGLVAVDLTADLRVTFDGEDITAELPEQERLADFTRYSAAAVLPSPLAGERGERYGPEPITLEMPPAPQWAESGGGTTAIEATIEVGGWCVPGAD